MSRHIALATMLGLAAAGLPGYANGEAPALFDRWGTPRQWRHSRPDRRTTVAAMKRAARKRRNRARHAP